MHLKVFKTVWGHEGTLEDACSMAREAGFHGIEAPVPKDVGLGKEFLNEMSGSGLEWVCEVSTCTDEGLFVPRAHESAEAHLESLERGMERCLGGRPQFLNVMGGSDAWCEQDAMRFYEGVLLLEDSYKLPISMETHRGRYSSNPWRMVEVMDVLPELKVTCDFSHWCVVTERLVLEEEKRILSRMAEQVYHIHGRVGYAQGAQVPDPRAPEYLYALEAHERWWGVLWEGMRERGFDEVTMTPEFGPDGYLQAEPFTQKPVADLWEINRWMGQREAKRFHEKYKIKGNELL